MKNSRAQIVATIGPASESPAVLRAMLTHGLDVVRLNFSWGDRESRIQQIAHIRECEKEFGRRIPIIIDLPGPRVQEAHAHSYDPSLGSTLTEHDAACIAFGVEQRVDYFALSFVGSAAGVEVYKEKIRASSGSQKVIAKIERTAALEELPAILVAADAVMVARGDLGNEVPLEQIPFVQEQIVRAAKAAGKPAIVATQMLLSMVEEPTPTRAEVTDVSSAVLEGADAVMLSEETAVGKYPVETVMMMEKILLEAEAHMSKDSIFNSL